MKPRVLAVHPNSEMYGSDRMFLAAVAHMPWYGAADVMAVLPQEGPLADALREQGVPVATMDFPVLRKTELRPARAPSFAARSAASVRKLASWLRREQVDVVYVSTIICPTWLLAARRAGCRVVCHVHENEPDMGERKRQVLLAPLLAAHRIIANSEATRHWIADAYPTLADRTRVIYNGVVDSGDAASEWTPVPGSIVVVGRLSERKGQDVAIMALSVLRDRGYDATLTLVGDCYPGYEGYVQRLRNMVDHLVPGAVTFAGFHDDPRPFLASAAAAVVPSRVEPFGNVAVEAIAAGVPTVVSGVQGLTEIVRDGETGRVVRPESVLELADALAAIFDDPESAAAMAKRGQKDVERRFELVKYQLGVKTAALWPDEDPD